MSARTGKIGRLPRAVRDEVNERLDGSEPGPQLLAWLNALPEVKAALAKYFGGAAITKQNLSEWRQGGFQEWLLRRDFRQEAGDSAEFAGEIREQRPDRALADDAATVLAARYGGLLCKWNGEPDKKTEAKARILNRLCRGLTQLRRDARRTVESEPAGPESDQVKPNPSSLSVKGPAFRVA